MGLSRGEAPRDRSCARRERWDRRSFRAVARGGIRVSTFQRSLRPDPAAAGARGMGSVPPIYTKGDTLYYTDVVAGAPRDRSCVRRERWDRRSFRAVARGGIRVSTFQCSLRPDPAAAGECVVGGYLLVFWDRTLGFTLC